jgi:hypothetical protein
MARAQISCFVVMVARRYQRGPLAAGLLALSLGASQAFGLLPLWFVRRVRVSDALAEDGTAPAGGGLRTHSGRLRSAILAAQVGVATLLLGGHEVLRRRSPARNAFRS